MIQTPEPNAPNIEAAIQQGLHYLRQRQQNGCWQGFATMAGLSDIWVTGFVTAHLQQILREDEAIDTAQHFLAAARKPNGGWSYSAVVPPDADSTAWCLMSMQNDITFKHELLQQSQTFLWSHATENGISTYDASQGIAAFIGVPDVSMLAGWTAAHPDVSIAAILADPFHPNVKAMLQWLLTLQQPDGLLPAYWWRSPFYTSTLLLRACSVLQVRLPEAQAGSMLQALISQQLDDGGFALSQSNSMDAFTTALALESFIHLQYLGGQYEMNRCADALLQAQQQDGHWAGDFVLRIPAPYILHPQEDASWSNASGGGNSLVHDEGGLFATTLACYALHKWTQSNNNQTSVEQWAPLI